MSVAVYEYLKAVSGKAWHIRLESYCAAEHGNIRVLSISYSELQETIKVICISL